MTGKQLREKIKDRGFTFRQIAQTIGESDANFQNLISAADVKSGTLERIAMAMGEDVSYFYSKQPIFTLADYVEYESTKRENELLREIVRAKEEMIAELRK